MIDAAPRKRTRDGQATREKIFLEAIRLFARKGFDATSIKDIANAVGVADAALYRHFASKEEIASAIFSFHYSNLARSVAALARNSEDFGTALGQLVTLLCDLFDDTPDVFAFILLNQHDHLRFIREGDNVVSELVGIMQRAIDRSEISVASPELAASLALGAAIQPAVFCLYGRLTGPLGRYRDDIEKAVASALGVARK
jgi:AcrR family transcriptional regulator